MLEGSQVEGVFELMVWDGDIMGVLVVRFFVMAKVKKEGIDTF